jgi:hypothetical protein
MAGDHNDLWELKKNTKISKLGRKRRRPSLAQPWCAILSIPLLPHAGGSCRGEENLEFVATICMHSLRSSSLPTMKRARPTPPPTPPLSTTKITRPFSKKPKPATPPKWVSLGLTQSELSLPLTFPTSQTFRWRQTGPLQISPYKVYFWVGINRENLPRNVSLKGLFRHGHVLLFPGCACNILSHKSRPAIKDGKSTKAEEKGFEEEEEEERDGNDEPLGKNRAIRKLWF